MDKDSQKEKRERTSFVLGIFTASVIGFVINLYTSIYYDVFLIGVTTIDDYSQPAIIFPTVIFVLAIALLTFLVYDYKNELDLNRSFVKRFLDYYHNVFWLSRLIQKLSKGLIFFIKWFFALIIAISLYDTNGFKALVIWITFIVCWMVAKRVEWIKIRNFMMRFLRINV